MESRRLDYLKLAPEGIARMRALEHYLNTGTDLAPTLLELVRLRVSLMNGCDLCIAMHTSELKKHNEASGRIGSVSAWRDSDTYTHRERAALAWAEALTNIQDGHAPDAVYDQTRLHFSEAEVVNLTLVITTINAWNRLAIGLGERSCRP